MTTSENVTMQAWTTENENAVVWGTHDIETAKKVYRELILDTEPDWDAPSYYWALPGLDEEEVWPKNSVSEEEKDGWVPFLSFDF